jgi:acetyl-CoA carboxylase carboxyltransferase component
LGGAVTHTEISGIADYKFDTEQECLTQIKKIMSKLGDQPKAGFNKIKAIAPAKN